MSAMLPVVIGLPAAAGAVLLLAGRYLGRGDGQGARALSISVAAGTLAAAIAAAITRPTLELPLITPDGAGLAVDGLSAVLLPAVAAVALLVLIFAAADRTRPAARFHGLMLIFAAAVMFTACATSLPGLLGAWEIMGATSYALIGFHWQAARTVPAGLVAFTVTRTADLGLYAAAGAALLAGTGWHLDDLAGAGGPWLHVIAAGVLIAGLGKAAQLPFSFWLSRAMEGPSPVSALLHSAAMVAMGGYLLLRLSPLLAATGWAGLTAAWFGAGTAIILGIIALAQTDLKQLLAASTAAQLGFVILAAGVGATAGGAAQLVAHAATKALLFLVAGAWLGATGSKQFPALRGVARRWPVAGAAFLIGSLSLAGLPPLSLWLTKDTILTIALHERPGLYAAGLVGAALAAAYSAKMIAVALAKPDQQAKVAIEREYWDTEQPGTRRIPAGQVWPLIMLAAAAIAAGTTATPGMSGWFRTLLHARSQPQASGVELAASAVIALIVAALMISVVLRRSTHRPPVASRLDAGSGRRAVGDWFGLERAAARVIVRPTFATARTLARLDDRINQVVLASVRLLVHTATSTATFDRAVGSAVRSVTRGAAGLGRAARRTQTGAIADYYAGAAILTVAATVLLIVVR